MTYTGGAFAIPAPPGAAVTKTGILVMGGQGDQGLATPTNSDVCQRWGFTLPVSPFKYRIRIRNSNLIANTAQAGAISLTGVWLGAPAGGENQWNGDFAATPNQVLPAQSFDGGSEWVTPWITTPGMKAGVFYGLSVGFTCPGVQVNNTQSPGWSWVGTGSAAAAGAAAAPGTAAQPYKQYLDIRVEYQYVGTNQLGLFVGQSITAGWLNTISGSVATGHMGPDSTWPALAGLALSHSAMNAGVPQATSASWNVAPGPANLLWARLLSPESGYTAFATVPDYAVIDLGVNDSSDTVARAGANLSLFQANFLAVVAKLQALGITRIYATTATPGYTVSVLASLPAWQAGGVQTALAGATTSIVVKFTAGPGPNGGQPGAGGAWWAAANGPWRIFVGSPQNPVVNGGPITPTGVAGGSGANLTLTIPSTNLTAAVGVPVLTASEYYRQAINLWLRSVPPGVAGVIDFDADVTTQTYYPSAIGRPEFYNNAGDVHPTGIAMYNLMASRFQAFTAGQ